MLKLVDENEEVRKSLVEHLPEGQQTEDNLNQNLRSP
jgi:hypothetical protein